MNEIQEIKSEIQKLQEEIKLLKNENKKLKGADEAEKRFNLPEAYKAELDEAIKPVSQLIDKIFEENSIEAMVVSISKTRNGSACLKSVLKSIDDLNEESLAAVCEVFANPRRIAILKILSWESLTASEIGQRTGLVGGQLYHHLASLEGQHFIKKSDDKYEMKTDAHIMLMELYACFGFMLVAGE